MGLYIQGGKKIGGMYMADGRGNATKVGGMYYADGKGNAIPVIGTGFPPGVKIVGFDKRGNFNGDEFKVNPKMDTSVFNQNLVITLTQPIPKLRNGIKIIFDDLLIYDLLYFSSYSWVYSSGKGGKFDDWGYEWQGLPSSVVVSKASLASGTPVSLGIKPQMKILNTVTSKPTSTDIFNISVTRVTDTTISFQSQLGGTTHKNSTLMAHVTGGGIPTPEWFDFLVIKSIETY